MEALCGLGLDRDFGSGVARKSIMNLFAFMARHVEFVQSAEEALPRFDDLVGPACAWTAIIRRVLLRTVSRRRSLPLYNELLGNLETGARDYQNVSLPGLST